MSSSGAVRTIIQARTPAAGFALINGTPTIVTFNTPNDGQLHGYTVAVFLNSTVAEVGGAVMASYTIGGIASTAALLPGGQGPGQATGNAEIVADPNTAVAIKQTSALTGGNGTVYGVITGN